MLLETSLVPKPEGVPGAVECFSGRVEASLTSVDKNCLRQLKAN